MAPPKTEDKTAPPSDTKGKRSEPSKPEGKPAPPPKTKTEDKPSEPSKSKGKPAPPPKTKAEDRSPARSQKSRSRPEKQEAAGVVEAAGRAAKAAAKAVAEATKVAKSASEAESEAEAAAKAAVAKAEAAKKVAKEAAKRVKKLKSKQTAADALYAQLLNAAEAPASKEVPKPPTGLIDIERRTVGVTADEDGVWIGSDCYAPREGGVSHDEDDTMSFCLAITGGDSTEAAQLKECLTEKQSGGDPDQQVAPAVADVAQAYARVTGNPVIVYNSRTRSAQKISAAGTNRPCKHYLMADGRRYQRLAQVEQPELH